MAKDGSRKLFGIVSAPQRLLLGKRLCTHCVYNSIGLILCPEGNSEHIEYLMLDEQSPIKVAQYYTQLPDKKILAEKLQRAIAIAREHYLEQ